MADTPGMPGLIRPPQPLVSNTRANRKVFQEEGKDLQQVCRDFEAVFLNYMLQQMRRTIPQDGLFNGGRAEQIYTSMLDNETAKSIASQKGLGLASLLEQQLAALGPPKNE